MKLKRLCAPSPPCGHSRKRPRSHRPAAPPPFSLGFENFVASSLEHTTDGCNFPSPRPVTPICVGRGQRAGGFNFEPTNASMGSSRRSGSLSRSIAVTARLWAHCQSCLSSVLERAVAALPHSQRTDARTDWRQASVIVPLYAFSLR
jgi:hypothetical protein